MDWIGLVFFIDGNYVCLYYLQNLYFIENWVYIFGKLYLFEFSSIINRENIKYIIEFLLIVNVFLRFVIIVNIFFNLIIYFNIFVLVVFEF